MDINRIEKELEKLGQKNFNFNYLLSEIKLLKEKSVAALNEEQANKLWVIETIVEIHKDFVKAFNLLKSRKYSDGWVLLERIEISISFLKKHFHLVPKNYKVSFIEKKVLNLQALFPYKLFGSNEMLHKEEKCTICGTIVSLRNHCGHIPLELYMGEMCSREVTKFDFLGLAIVQNPVNKYSVIFKESKDKNVLHNHQFGNLNYILSRINNPYDQWSLEISQTLFPYTDFNITNLDEICPCGDGKAYKDCCISRGGIRGYHYQFSIAVATKKDKSSKRKSK